MSRIIASVLVYDDGPDKSTELNQRVPVAAVTSQPRRFDREYATDATFADRCQQSLEARPIDATAGAAKIIVDDLDSSPAELPGTIGEPVLTAAALRIVQKLIGRRLADVDESAPAQVVSRDLGHRRLPRLPALTRSPSLSGMGESLEAHRSRRAEIAEHQGTTAARHEAGDAPPIRTSSTQVCRRPTRRAAE